MPDGTAGDLPNWDLPDLYPAPDSPALEADLARAEPRRAISRRGMPGGWPECRAPRSPLRSPSTSGSRRCSAA